MDGNVLFLREVKIVIFLSFQMSLIILRPIFVVFQLYKLISKIVLNWISALHTFYYNCACKKKHDHCPTAICTNNNNNNEYVKSPHNKKPNYSKNKQKLGIEDVPGPPSFPFIGSSWLYTRFGPYTHKKYHESNDDKYLRYGPVVREKILFNTLIHLFDKDDINKILSHK